MQINDGTTAICECTFANVVLECVLACLNDCFYNIPFDFVCRLKQENYLTMHGGRINNIFGL